MEGKRNPGRVDDWNEHPAGTREEETGVDGGTIGDHYPNTVQDTSREDETAMTIDDTTRQHAATIEITQGSADPESGVKKYTIRIVAREDTAEQALSIALGSLQMAQTALGGSERWHLETDGSPIDAWLEQADAMTGDDSDDPGVAVTGTV